MNRRTHLISKVTHLLEGISGLRIYRINTHSMTLVHTKTYTVKQNLNAKDFGESKTTIWKYLNVTELYTEKFEENEGTKTMASTHTESCY